MELLVFNLGSGTWALVGDVMVDTRETSFEKLDKPKSRAFWEVCKNE